jgi:pyridoxamine 5'-phosphate oxidase
MEVESSVPLRKRDIDPDPIRQFERWHAEAGTDAATLVTASADGAPSGRVVLVKGVSPRGFEFHTNRLSAKGRDLAANPRAELVFYWPPDRQVRVNGPVEELSREECDAYWRTRPPQSQLGAWASRQSEPIANREALELRLAELSQRFGDDEIPRPEFWGGYRVVPVTIEVWHHQEDRLHDRLRYRVADGGWVVERLAP